MFQRTLSVEDVKAGFFPWQVLKGKAGRVAAPPTPKVQPRAWKKDPHPL